MYRLFFRDPNCTSWSITTYDIVCDFSDEETGDLLSSFNTMWKCGSFFIMRSGVNPVWEDEANSNGGCISFTMSPQDTFTYLSITMASYVSGELSLGTRINGVSVSPKKDYSLIRIWTEGTPSATNIKAPLNSVIHYKPHSDSIRGKKTCINNEHVNSNRNGNNRNNRISRGNGGIRRR